MRIARADGRLSAPAGALRRGAVPGLGVNLAGTGRGHRAIEAPRFVTHSLPHTFEPHLYQPGRLDLEASLGADVGEALARKGHLVHWRPAVSTNVSGVCAIRADLRSGTIFGGADPRRAARAIGW